MHIFFLLLFSLLISFRFIWFSFYFYFICLWHVNVSLVSLSLCVGMNERRAKIWWYHQNSIVSAMEQFHKCAAAATATATTTVLVTFGALWSWLRVWRVSCIVTLGGMERDYAQCFVDVGKYKSTAETKNEAKIQKWVANMYIRSAST